MIDGPKVRKLRTARDLSQAELARMAGVKQPTIASIEAGKQKSSRATPRLARVLGVEIAELDPDFVNGLGSPTGSSQTIDMETAATAFEAMLERLRPDLGNNSREGLVRLFLDLALEPLDGKNGLTPIEQHRERLRIAIRQFLKR